MKSGLTFFRSSLILNCMERIVKTFFHVFTRSLFPHHHYYSKIIKTPFSFSFKYFFMLLLVFNVCFVLFLAVKYNPKKLNSRLSALSTNLSYYPDNLVITLHKGRLITNNNHPYLLWFDDQDKKNLLLVVDETATAKKIELYGSSALLTAQELVINGSVGNISSLPLNYLDDQKITKEKISQLVQKIDKARMFLPFLFIAAVVLLILLVPLVSFIVTFVYLFLSSIIVFLVFKFFLQKHFHFRKIFQVSFHAVTLPLFLDYSLMILRPTIRMGSNFFLPLRQIPFPMLFLIVLAVFVAIGVHEAHVEEHEVKLHHRKKR